MLENRKKTQRVYTEEGLTVCKRRARRRAVGAKAAPPVLALPNQRWNLDFVHDRMASGRRFRVLNIVDDVTRESLAAVPDTSISGRRVVRELSVREIAGHLHELYGIDVSADLISTVTDAVLDEVATWQQRPLDAAYPLVLLPCLRGVAFGPMRSG